MDEQRRPPYSSRLWIPACMDSRFPGQLQRKAVCWYWKYRPGVKCMEGNDCAFLHPLCKECNYPYDQIFFYVEGDPSVKTIVGRLDRFSKPMKFYARDDSEDSRVMSHLDNDRKNVCRHWIKNGRCNFGDECIFLHPYNE